MNHRLIARFLLCLFCAIQGVATLVIDLNRTHATNPAWPGHARFHLVWQNISVALLSVLVIALVSWPGAFGEQRFYLAAILTGIPMLAFLGALAFRTCYGGTLSDPNGIAPARVVISSRLVRVDLNLIAVVAGLFVLGAILSIYAGQ